MTSLGGADALPEAANDCELPVRESGDPSPPVVLLTRPLAVIGG
jgi:hypothetical protein